MICFNSSPVTPPEKENPRHAGRWHREWHRPFGPSRPFFGQCRSEHDRCRCMASTKAWHVLQGVSLPTLMARCFLVTSPVPRNLLGSSNSLARRVLVEIPQILLKADHQIRPAEPRSPIRPPAPPSCRASLRGSGRETRASVPELRL